MSEVITVQDLETLKKHEIFEAEVITGKVGGLVGGEDIPKATNPVTGQVQTTLPEVLKQLGFKPAAFTFVTGGTLNPGDHDLAVYNPTPNGDGNWYSWGGVMPKVVAPNSTPQTSGGFGPAAWLQKTDNILRPSVREALRRTYADANYNLVSGSFESGGTLNSAADVLLHETSGIAYSNAGPFPIVVAAGTDPSSGGYTARNNEFLRAELGFYVADWVDYGESDAAIFINRALDYVASLGGGIVKLLPKTYTIFSQILIPENCTLDGAGIDKTVVFCHGTMPRNLNSITTKNNPMHYDACTAIGGANSSYTYASNMLVSNLTVNSNGVVRQAGTTGTVATQSCGVKFVSAKHSGARNVKCVDSLLHGFDIAASAYFDSGNYKENIPGGSEDCFIEDCISIDAGGDDLFTAHNSTRITIKNCKAYRTNGPIGYWNHGFEVDEGCSYVDLVDCYSENSFVGFQVKGHATTMPSSNVTLTRCHAKNCNDSFILSHRNYMSFAEADILARNVTLRDCISESPTNKLYPPTDTTYIPHHIQLYSYVDVVVDSFTMIGPRGYIEIGQGARRGSFNNLRHNGGYDGVFANATGAGLINIVTGATKGGFTFQDIIVSDPVNLPVLRAPDAGLATGQLRNSIKGVIGIGSNAAIPLLFLHTRSFYYVSDVHQTGFSSALSAHTGTTPVNPVLDFEIVNGLFHYVGAENPITQTPITPHPNGSTYLNSQTGDRYISRGAAGPDATGNWTQLSP